MSDTPHVLDRLIQRWFDHYQQSPDGLPQVEQDPEWSSCCELPQTLKDGHLAWQPMKCETAKDFSNIEHAMQLNLHPDIKHYYSCYWSGELAAKHQDHAIYLLQLWNQQDFLNLQQNIIGHLMMKQRLGQQLTLFFALTDDDQQIISLLNDSGEIWLETVGCEPHLKLADSMAEFLDELTF